MYFKLMLCASALNKPGGFLQGQKLKSLFSAADDALQVDGLPCYQG